ncbi:MAG: methyltransferase domain-containing protein, partial [candidate division Zixibacteria bacterium]|nr:methyltransferase domain-containing protein [candidate division Zixibacteria bacterium]
MNTPNGVPHGEARFAFGDNWRRYAARMTDRHIEEAEHSMAALLGGGPLKGKQFLDAGCGSGIHGLAARRMGARVHAFDFDEQSVACALELKKRFRPGDRDWVVEPGSVLDAAYLKGLGRFDVVYSWGVLHHTGRMWDALDALQKSVSVPGYLVLALYNDQGVLSR